MEATKKDRKSPEPRGLILPALPLETTAELQELATIAGITTKEALAAEFGLFLTGKVLDLFRAHLTDKGQAKIDAARAKLPAGPPLRGTITDQRALTSDGGIPLLPLDTNLKA